MFLRQAITRARGVSVPGRPVPGRAGAAHRTRLQAGSANPLTSGSAARRGVHRKDTGPRLPFGARSAFSLRAQRFFFEKDVFFPARAALFLRKRWFFLARGTQVMSELAITPEEKHEGMFSEK